MIMKILINRIIIVICIVCFSNHLFSQSLVEADLTTNQILVKKSHDLIEKSQMRTGSSTDTLSLGVKGILDDFSNDGPYPDTTYWLDNNVYINYDYAKAPITLGVATFEGLTSLGVPYDFTVTPTSSNKADYLTSKPIDLSVILPTDTTVYLSFYYQPQGLGNDPESHDSLVMEFKAPAGSWNWVWAKKGTNLASADSSWKLAMIPIRGALYLQKGFQFRIYNWATLSGNLDHWSIDYLYLNKNRSINDTSFEDISFVYRTPSLLNVYSAKPWRHYATTDMKTIYSDVIRNNHTVQKFGSYEYRIFDGIGTQVNTTYGPFANNIDPFATIGYFVDPPVTSPPLNYTIPLLSAPENYTIQSILFTSPDFNRENDTVEHVQEFSNYYAYDDGTAETALGLNTLDAELAEKFTSTLADTLQYIDIYFNPIVTNAALWPNAFTLKVWGNAGGNPGSALFTSATNMTPAYYGTGTNVFIRYPLSTPLYLNPGTFFIGFHQNTNTPLNVGMDKNTNNQSKIYYNVTGLWNTSPIPGSLMMHPVFGSTADFVGVQETALENKFLVYPNPANDKLFIKSAKSIEQKISYSVMDIYGRVIQSDSSLPEFINVSTFSNGVYFLRIVNNQTVSTNKFIIFK